MPFDEDLVLHDGTAITADISPTSLTKSSGSVCVELVGGTAKKGIVAHLLLANDLAETGDTLQVTLETCATVDGTYTELARFPLITYGDDLPWIISLLLAIPSFARFLRAKIVVSDDDEGDDFSVTGCFILLSTSML